MAYKHITDNTATQVDIGRIAVASIQVNTGLTGTITVYDATGSDTTPVVAVITNPAAGQYYHYFDLVTGFKVVASGACDITAETSSLRIA